MKEAYSQPILLVSYFKVSDSLMGKPSPDNSQWHCGSLWCTPNGYGPGHEGCIRDTSCYSDPNAPEGSDWGEMEAN